MLSRLLVAAVKLFIGAYPRWRGSQPSTTQRIYFANHASHLDTVALWSALPPGLRARTRPVAARDYWGSGIREVIARRGFNAVLIERDREKCAGDPLQPLYDALDAGDSLGPVNACGVCRAGPVGVRGKEERERVCRYATE